MKSLPIIILSLFLFSCGQSQQKTTAKISVAALTGSTKYGGGLILYADNVATGQSLIQAVPATDSVELELLNGEWNFKVVGWSGGANSKMFEGEPKCDFKRNVNLNGSIIDLTMTPSYARCVEAAQLAVAAGEMPSVNTLLDPDRNRFYRLSFGSCIDLTQKLQSENITNIPAQLGCGGGDFFLKSGAKSYKINLLAQKLSGERVAGLSSDCRPLGMQYRNYTDINIPLGHAFGANIVDIKVFESADCSGTPSRGARFSEGIKTQGFSDNNAAVAVFDPADFNNTQKWMFIAVDAQGCTAGAMANRPFAAGGPVAGGPSEYLICNKDQWHNIAAAICPAAVGVPAGSMNCEPDAMYFLGADIDFGGSNTTIANAFKGELNGNGRILSNGNSPLFQTISSRNDDDVYISDFTIENFNISLTEQNIGALAQEVVSVGTSSAERVEISRVNLVDSIIGSTYTGGGAGAVGGLIGLVNFSSATSSNNEMFFLRKSFSNSSVTSMHNFDTNVVTTTFATGGLVGKLIGPPRDGNSGGASLEYNSLGFNSEGNLDIDSDDVVHVLVEGYYNVGGLVGAMQSAEIREGNFTKVNLKGKGDIGGLIGSIYHNNANDYSELHNSMSFAKYTYDGSTFCTGAGVCRYIGGAIGSKRADARLRSEGVVSLFDIEITSSHNSLEAVGGFIGKVDQNGEMLVNDAKTYFNVQANGDFFGGLAGYANFTGMNQTHFEASVAHVNIDEASSTTENSSRGGAFGFTQNGNEKRIIVAGFDGNLALIKGNSKLGGFAGDFRGQTDEVSVDVNIVAGNLTLANAGGFAGVISNGDGTQPRNQNLKINAIIDLDATTGDSAGLETGILVGENLAPDNEVTFEGVVRSGSITRVGPTDITSDCGAGFCDGGIELVDIKNNNPTDCGLLIGGSPSKPFIAVGSECRLLFEKKWYELGYDTEENAYRSGGTLDPFLIDSVADWNSIGGDALLMSKSFRIDQDLDFNNGSATPIGDDGNLGTGTSFRGTIFGNGVIKNLNLTTSGNFFGGLINTMEDDASIGLRNQPLKFQNITIDCISSQSCGLVGASNGGRIFVELNNGDISGTSNNVGGLIGEVRNQLEVDRSSFQGRVNTSGDNAGGFFGVLGGSDPTELRMYESNVKLIKIEAVSYAGGFIGNGADAGGSVNSINDSYVWIDPLNFNSGADISATNAGGIAGNFDNDFELRNIYIDLSAADLSGVTTFQTLGNGGEETASTSSVDNVGVIRGQNTLASSGIWQDSGQFINFESMASSLNSFNDEYWVQGQAGRYVLNWEVYGHDN